MTKIITGFTLLEVLIATLVFSLGLLGIAALQMSSMRMSHDSLLRARATLLANDMADRMRANPAATDLGINSPYNNPQQNQAANPNCSGMNSSGATSNVSCSPAAMALNDFAEWYANLSGSAATAWAPVVVAQLPNASGVVCIDSTPNDGTPSNPGCDNIILDPSAPLYAIKIWWTEGQDQNAQTRSYVLAFTP